MPTIAIYLTDEKYSQLAYLAMEKNVKVKDLIVEAVENVLKEAEQ